MLGRSAKNMTPQSSSTSLTKPAWKKRAVMVLGFLVLVYVISYLPRRSNGSYSYSQSGEVRFMHGTGLSVSDIELWNPSGCFWQSHFQSVSGDNHSRSHGWGYVYAPLIMIDRKFNYPTKKLFSNNDKD